LRFAGDAAKSATEAYAHGQDDQPGADDRGPLAPRTLVCRQHNRKRPPRPAMSTSSSVMSMRDSSESGWRPLWSLALGTARA
jgi:hypothetical protein